MEKSSIYISIILATIFLVPTLAFGQGQLKLASLEVDLWPEYDRPDVLVIYRIGLPSNASHTPSSSACASPPLQVHPTRVAAKQPDGSLDYTAVYPTETVEVMDDIKVHGHNP